MAGDTILCNTSVVKAGLAGEEKCSILNMLYALQVPTGHPGGVSDGWKYVSELGELSGLRHR